MVYGQHVIIGDTHYVSYLSCQSLHHACWMVNTSRLLLHYVSYLASYNRYTYDLAILILV
jgi:hypothetical protein